MKWQNYVSEIFEYLPKNVTIVLKAFFKSLNNKIILNEI